ncbi:MAG: hypothetical protein IJF74_03625 [Clostridia bacterium]|nr:hypothetical protein [Clostridia bacterium]
MREKACSLVYLNAENYISFYGLRMFYRWSFLVHFMFVVTGIHAINMFGVTWRTLFPIFAAVIWCLFYLVFICKVARAKKTFELRFLVNGISGLFISSFIWLLHAVFGVMDEYQGKLNGFDFCLWVLFFYIIFSVIYVTLIVSGVHKGVYKKAKGEIQKAKALLSAALHAAIIPTVGLICVYVSEMLRGDTSKNVKDIFMMTVFVLLFFLTALAHINFVQYFYCKKYKIFCDKNGNTNSPDLYG